MEGVAKVFSGILISFLLIIPVNAKTNSKVIVYHAGSLKAPFEKMESAFERKYPEVDVVLKSGGSTKMARFISKLGHQADIMASADFTVIDKNLIPDYAQWNIRFATNQMVLCYTDKSRFASEITEKNWYKILVRKGVDWAHTDPDIDPCGYRSLMVLQLSEKFYKIPGYYNKVNANRPKKNIFDAASEMISVLKDGKIDYAWEYLSVAVQNNLKYIKLNENISLGNYKYDDFYKQAKVKVAGKELGTWITYTAKSCTYGVTLIRNSQNPKAATAFLEYMLDSKQGLSILKQMGQPPFVPCHVSNRKVKKLLPSGLKTLVEINNP